MYMTTVRTLTPSRAAMDGKANPRRGGLPLGFEAGDANLYRYVSNKPTLLTDPSGLESGPPNQQPAEPVFGETQLRAILGLSGATNEGRTAIYDSSMLAAGYGTRGETLTPPVASAVFYGWERIINRGFPTVGMGANARSTMPLQTAADRAAADVLREIERRTSAIALSVYQTHLLNFPIGVNAIAANITSAAGLDAMTRTMVRRLDYSDWRARSEAELILHTLLGSQPAVVAEILVNSQMVSREQERRRNNVIDVPQLRELERLNSNVFRKYAEAVFREFLRPLPETEINRILAGNPDPDAAPNHTRLMRLIRGR